MFGSFLEPGRASRVKAVFGKIEELLDKDGMTQAVLIDRLSVVFSLKKLIEAFIASLFCLPAYVDAYVDYIHTNTRNGVEYTKEPYASTTGALLRLFATKTFNIRLRGDTFCLFDSAESTDCIWVPIKGKMGGYALFLLKMILTYGEWVLPHNENTMTLALGTVGWFEKDCDDSNEFRGTTHFVEYANKIVNRTSWIRQFLTLSVVAPLGKTTNHEQHQLLFGLALQMFDSVCDDELLVDSVWFDQGKQLLSDICGHELEVDETMIALDVFLRFVGSP